MSDCSQTWGHAATWPCEVINSSASSYPDTSSSALDRKFLPAPGKLAASGYRPSREKARIGFIPLRWLLVLLFLGHVLPELLPLLLLPMLLPGFAWVLLALLVILSELNMPKAGLGSSPAYAKANQTLGPCASVLHVRITVLECEDINWSWA